MRLAARDVGIITRTARRIVGDEAEWIGGGGRAGIEDDLPGRDAIEPGGADGQRAAEKLLLDPGFPAMRFLRIERDIPILAEHLIQRRRLETFEIGRASCRERVCKYV